MLNNVKEGNNIIGQIYDVWPPLMRSEKAEQEMTRIGSSAAFHNTIGLFSENFFYNKKNHKTKNSVKPLARIKNYSEKKLS